MGILSGLAARELEVSSKTLNRWADEGRIRCVRSVTGWRLYPPSEIERVRKLLEARRFRG